MCIRDRSDVANITFLRMGSGTDGPGAYANEATILFGDYTGGRETASAFAYYPGSRSAQASEGDVWVNFTIDFNQAPTESLGFGGQVLVHEIGHALGLAHPSDYGANVTGANEQYL